MIQFDQYFSDGLKPPASWDFMFQVDEMIDYDRMIWTEDMRFDDAGRWWLWLLGSRAAERSSANHTWFVGHLVGLLDQTSTDSGNVL